MCSFLILSMRILHLKHLRSIARGIANQFVWLAPARCPQSQSQRNGRTIKQRASVGYEKNIHRMHSLSSSNSYIPYASMQIMFTLFRAAKPMIKLTGDGRLNGRNALSLKHTHSFDAMANKSMNIWINTKLVAIDPKNHSASFYIIWILE